jgi:hypothetical protein
MPSVDDRIVRMEFDNASFERKISTTLASLGKLDKALEFKDAGKAFDGLSKSAGKFDLSHIASAVEHISSKFSALGAIGFTAIQSLTRGALSFAKKIGGDILDPIITGGTKRAKNIEQAKFMFQGLGIDVEKGMDSALKAVKGTAFGLDEAAKAAAQFGASGIKVGDDMTGALKGVAGAAAMTGSSFTEMADIFAGSAGTGKVTNMDLMQFATRGLNAAAAVGKVLGKTEAQVHEMATAGTLDFQTFAGAMNEAFGSHATEANKTYTGALANLHAAMSRLGEAFIGPRLTQQRDLFNALSPVVDDLTKALKPLFFTIQGITQLMTTGLIKNLKGLDFSSLKKAMPFIQKGLLNIFDAFGRILTVGKKAFKDIFPASLGPNIVKIAKIFQTFTEHLLMGGETAGKLRRIFDGVFSVLSIGYNVIKEAAKFFGQLFLTLTGFGKGNALEFFAKIGDFFTQLNKDLVKGGAIKDFFATLANIIKEPIPFIKQLGTAIKNFFTGFDPSMPKKLGDGLGRLGDRFQSLKGMFKGLEKIWDPFANALQKVFSILDRVWVAIRDWFARLGQKIADVMGKGDFSAVLDAINVGLLGGIAALIATWMKKGINVDLTGGVMQSLTGTFNQLTGVLKSMQMEIKAEALMKIAEAIAVLTASMVVLSLIDSAALTKALTAMAVGFGQLMGAFAILNKMDASIKSGAQFDLIAGGMIALSTAMLILSGAIAIIGHMKLGDVVKGVAAIGVLLGLLIASSKGLEKAAPGLIIAGVGLTAISIALTILAGAVALFGTMDLVTMAKGIIGLSLALAGIALAMQLMPTNIIITGVGLIFVATALNILAGAMKIFGTINYSEMLRGFVAIGGALLIIGIAMHAMPITLPITAAGLVLVSIALNLIAKALGTMGGMSWGEIGKGLTTLAASLIILAVAANAMTSSIVGAVAIGIMAASLILLASALKAFASLSWGDLLHGLVGVAAALALLGLAALALTPVIPEMLALGAALIVIGAGFALIGAGAFMIGKAFESLAKAGKAGAEALGGALYAIGEAIPKLLQGVAQGLIDFIMIIGKALPPLAKLLGTFLIYLADELAKLVPKLGELVRSLITELLSIIETYIPGLAEMGLHILLAILQGISDNLPEIVHTVGDIITGFLDAMAVEVPRIADSLANFIIEAYTGAAEAVGRVAGSLMFGVGIAFIKGFSDGIMSSIGGPMRWFMGLAGRVLGWIGNMLGTLFGKGSDLIAGMLNGINNRVGGVISFFTGIGGRILGAVGNFVSLLFNKGFDLIVGLWHGISDRWNALISWITGLGGEILSAVGNIGNTLYDIGAKIIQGLWDGMKSVWDKATGWLGSLGGGIAKIKGPPKEDAVILYNNGMLIMQGLHNGMQKEWKNVDKWLSEIDPAESLNDNIGDNMTKVIAGAMDQITAMENLNPVITPVLDLTAVAEEAKKVNGYFPDTLTATYATASAIATDTNAIKAASVETTPVGTGDVKFEQNIYAPEQLSTADIYKQTRNQITLAKEELSIP